MVFGEQIRILPRLKAIGYGLGIGLRGGRNLDKGSRFGLNKCVAFKFIEFLDRRLIDRDLGFKV